LTFEEFADLCVKILDHEAQRGDDLGRITSSNYFKDLIRKELTHLGLCKMI